MKVRKKKDDPQTVYPFPVLFFFSRFIVSVHRVYWRVGDLHFFYYCFHACCYLMIMHGMFPSPISHYKRVLVISVSCEWSNGALSWKYEREDEELTSRGRMWCQPRAVAYFQSTFGCGCTVSFDAVVVVFLVGQMWRKYTLILSDKTSSPSCSAFFLRLFCFATGRLGRKQSQIDVPDHPWMMGRGRRGESTMHASGLKPFSYSSPLPSPSFASVLLQFSSRALFNPGSYFFHCSWEKWVR